MSSYWSVSASCGPHPAVHLLLRKCLHLVQCCGENKTLLLLVFCLFHGVIVLCIVCSKLYAMPLVSARVLEAHSSMHTLHLTANGEGAFLRQDERRGDIGTPAGRRATHSANKMSICYCCCCVTCSRLPSARWPLALELKSNHFRKCERHEARWRLSH